LAGTTLAGAILKFQILNCFALSAHCLVSPDLCSPLTLGTCHLAPETWTRSFFPTYHLRPTTYQTPETRHLNLGTGVIWSAVIPAKAGIHAPTIALPLCTSPSGLELLGANGSNLPLDSRFRGNDCLHRPARRINFLQMTSIRSTCHPWQFGPRRATRLMVPARKKGAGSSACKWCKKTSDSLA
jgi:hypothetical protein